MSKFKNHRATWTSCDACSLCRSRTNVVLARGSVPADVLFIGEAPGDGEDVLGRPFVGPAGKLLDEMIVDAGFDPASKEPSIAFTNLVACVPNLPSPKVVNVKTDEYDIKIDRTTPWGNPFIIGKDGNRKEVIAQYREWIMKQPSLLLSIEQLAGLRLGCHCAPKDCHGDVIVELYEEIVSQRKNKEPPEWSIKACKKRLREFYKMCKPKLVVCVGTLSKIWVPKLIPEAKQRVDIIHPAAILRMNEAQRGLIIQRTTETLQGAFDEMAGGFLDGNRPRNKRRRNSNSRNTNHKGQKGKVR